MARLGHVAFDGIVGTRAVLDSVGVGEARPGRIIVGFDSGKPGVEQTGKPAEAWR